MFSESERRVFKYKVGGEERCADPLAVRRALLRHSAGQFHQWRDDAVEPEGHGAVSHGVEGAPPDPPELALARKGAMILGALEAQERVLDCVRAAFELPAFDPLTGQGCTEGEVWDVLDAYEEWLSKNGRAAGNSQTISPADSRPEAAG